MLRHLYRAAVRLHPASFRSRFGGEMLSIFDSAQGKSTRFGLFCDCFVSSIRQQTVRREFWAEVSASPAVQAADGIPSFTSLDGFRPRTSAVIDGIVLSAALFVVTCFAIRYSWIHVLHLQMPRSASENSIYTGTSPSELRGRHTSEPQRSLNADDQSGLISEHLQVDVMPVEAGSAVLAPGISRATTGNPVSQPQLPAAAVTLQLPLESYAGTYQSRSPRMTIRIVVKNGQLSMRIAGESPRMLSPVSETEFVIAGDEVGRIEFLTEKNGKLDRLQLSRDGQQITAERQ